MANAYLGMGSNLGDRRKQLIAATIMLAERVGDILAFSNFYETVPWGYQSVHTFLNMAVRLETSLSPYELLAATLQIEHELGRTVKCINQSYTDRTIDIDILLYDDVILHFPDLVLPHPLMHKRLFVLQPLSEIASDFIHPVFQKTVTELYQDLLSDSY